MTYSEYNDLITQIIKLPEKAPETAQKVLDAIKVDTDTLESQKAHTAELEGKIRDLQDTNIKLFLAQTGKKQDVDTHEDEPETLDSLVRELGGKTDGNE